MTTARLDPIPRVKDRVRDRVAALPDAVLDCEACGADASMQLRRSSLNESFYADDVGLKCSTCRYYRTHGIPFEDADEFARERAARDDRTVDFARDGAGAVTDRLRHLGYLAAADGLEHN